MKNVQITFYTSLHQAKCTLNFAFRHFLSLIIFEHGIVMKFHSENNYLHRRSLSPLQLCVAKKDPATPLQTIPREWPAPPAVCALTPISATNASYF